jgi:hypothetical protein
MPSFSQRRGYARAREIRVREELPPSLRRPLVDIAARRVGSKRLREIVEGVLDPYGTDPHRPSEGVLFVSMFGQVDVDLNAVRERIDRCSWFRVYDIIEALFQVLAHQDQQGGIPVECSPHAHAFEQEVNNYFLHEGIGWQVIKGEVVTRGNDAFESTARTALGALAQTGKPTAAKHLQFAIGALSARPIANTSGAVAHATNAVECVLGEITGQAMTLGKYLDKYPGLFHPALKKGLDGIYGYASDEGARHGRKVLNLLGRKQSSPSLCVPPSAPSCPENTPNDKSPPPSPTIPWARHLIVRATARVTPDPHMWPLKRQIVADAEG